MENWQDKIGIEIRSSINLDAFAKNYLAKIIANIKAGEPLNYAVRHAQNELRKTLIEHGIKVHDIVHLLHFCGLAIFPEMYLGCDCHEYLKK